jgi:hypothetical protein
MNNTSSMFRMMSDEMLINAIEKLERFVASLALTANASSWKASYRESLDLARAELERRRV